MPQFDEWDRDITERYNRRRREEEGQVFAPTGDATTTPGETPPSPDYGDFEFPEYGGPTSPYFQFGDVPRFDAPDFDVPTFAEAQQEPGYEFRLGTGRSALENSAAARGVLRTGGTLKDILEYGQNFGAQEYSNVFNRALQAYGTKYQGARDEYAPLLAQWQGRFGAEQARAMAEFQRYWDIYASDVDKAKYLEALRSGILNQPQPTPPTR